MLSQHSCKNTSLIFSPKDILQTIFVYAIMPVGKMITVFKQHKKNEPPVVFAVQPGVLLVQ